MSAIWFSSFATAVCGSISFAQSVPVASAIQLIRHPDNFAISDRFNLSLLTVENPHARVQLAEIR